MTYVLTAENWLVNNRTEETVLSNPSPVGFVLGQQDIYHSRMIDMVIFCSLSIMLW